MTSMTMPGAMADAAALKPNNAVPAAKVSVAKRLMVAARNIVCRIEGLRVFVLLPDRRSDPGNSEASMLLARRSLYT
jgi:hypothetical protein